MPFGANYAVRQIDADEWEALEDAGCVFLLGSGTRLYESGGIRMNELSIGMALYYWSSTASIQANATTIYFDLNSKICELTHYERYAGRPVRLVQDL